MNIKKTTNQDNKDLSASVKKSIDHFLWELRWNQSKLAMSAGLDISTLSLIYNGHRLPSLGTVERLADACGVKVSEFFAFGE